MRLKPENLAQELGRGLASVYLVSGDDPLLVGEAVDAIRSAARAAGYADRTVFSIERYFDWGEFRQAAQSLSLFAERRLFELRMPTGKPDKGAATLIDVATRPPPDVVCLIVTDKLDRKAGDTPWIRAVEEHGVWVQIWPVETAALPAWLRARAAALHIALDPQAAHLIVERVEGNLLAAKQELDKLVLLADGKRITAELVVQTVADSARFDVLQLGSAAAAGEKERTLRILLGLKSEGMDPTLILWALVRELRGLYQMQERRRLRGSNRGSGWHLAAVPTAEALSRLGKVPLVPLMRQAQHADRVLKGLARGDPWLAVTGLAAALSGALQATADSGRVPS